MSMPVIQATPITRDVAISNIIQSVALEQTAISHILNAEGEKIQKVVANGTIDEMLLVNQSVKSVVKSISNLEMILSAKLDLFSDCVCPGASTQQCLGTSQRCLGTTQEDDM